MGGDSWEFPIWYLLREKLSEQEMPIIVHETEENNIDLAANFVVYIDTTAPALIMKNLVRIEGFDKIQVYQNTRPESDAATDYEQNALRHGHIAVNSIRP
jgi:hypothetical protein